MKHIINIHFIIATILIMGCSGGNSSSDSEIEIPVETQDRSVLIEAAIQSGFTRINTEEGGNAWSDNDRITVKNTSSSAISGSDEATYIYQNGCFVAGGTLLWVDGSNSFEAWYPTEASFSSFILPTDQNSLTLIRKADWMTAQPAIQQMPDDRKLLLAFEHQLSIITVAITDYKGPSYENLKDEIVSSPQFTVASTLSVNATLPNNATVVNGYIPTDRRLESLPKMTAIVLPGTYADGETLMTFMIGEELQTMSLTEKRTIEAGKSYLFEINLSDAELTIGNVTVNDWESTYLSVTATASDGDTDM